MNDKARVLVVEDDPNSLYAYSHLLESAGFEVFQAATGTEGLRLADANRPDLILLDVRLPDIDGIEVCRRIKTVPELMKTLVISVSGLDIHPDDQVEGLEAGADVYLTKPVEARVLLAQVRALMRLKRAEASLVDQQQRELASLGPLSFPTQTVITARLFGIAPLHETAPEALNDMVDRYGDILDLALEARAYKVEDEASSRLHRLVEQLGFLKAGPRDVVYIHSAALKKKVASAPSRKAQAYVEEGRLRVLELMGYLASHYRNLSSGNIDRNTSG